MAAQGKESISERVEGGSPGQAHEADFGKGLEAVRDDLAKLRSDMNILAGTLRNAVVEELQHQSRETWSTAGRAADAMQDRLGRAAGAARSRTQHAARWTGETVGEHPMAALLVGLGLGVALGWMISERRR